MEDQKNKGVKETSSDEVQQQRLKNAVIKAKKDRQDEHERRRDVAASVMQDKHEKLLDRVKQHYRNGQTFINDENRPRPDPDVEYELTDTQKQIQLPLEMDYASKPCDMDTWNGMVDFMHGFFGSLLTHKPHSTTDERDTPLHNVITEVPVFVRQKGKSVPDKACNQFLEDSRTQLLRHLETQLKKLPPKHSNHYVVQSTSPAQITAEPTICNQFRVKACLALQKFAQTSKNGHVQGRQMHLGHQPLGNKVFMTILPTQSKNVELSTVAQRFAICFLRESESPIDTVLENSTCSDAEVGIQKLESRPREAMDTSETDEKMQESVLIKLKLEEFFKLYGMIIGNNFYLWETLLFRLYEYGGKQGDKPGSDIWWWPFFSKKSVDAYYTVHDLYYECEVLYRMAKALHHALRHQAEYRPYFLQLDRCFEQAQRPYTEQRNFALRQKADEVAVNQMQQTSTQEIATEPSPDVFNINTGMDQNTITSIDNLELDSMHDSTTDSIDNVYSILQAVNKEVQAHSPHHSMLSVAAQPTETSMDQLLETLNKRSEHCDFLTAKHVWHALISMRMVTLARVSLANAHLMHNDQSDAKTLFHWAAVRAILTCIKARTNSIPQGGQNSNAANDLQMFLRLVDVFGVCMITDVCETVYFDRMGEIVHRPSSTEDLLRIVAHKHSVTDNMIVTALKQPGAMDAFMPKNAGSRLQSESSSMKTQMNNKIMQLSTHCACKAMLETPHDMLAMVMHSTNNWCHWYKRSCEARLNPAKSNFDKSMIYQNVYRGLFHRIYHYLNIMLHSDVHLHISYRDDTVKLMTFQRLVFEYGFFDSPYGQDILTRWYKQLEYGVITRQRASVVSGTVFVQDKNEADQNAPINSMIEAQSLATIFSSSFRDKHNDDMNETTWSSTDRVVYGDISFYLQWFKDGKVLDANAKFRDFYDKVAAQNNCMRHLANFCINVLDTNITTRSQRDNPFDLHVGTKQKKREVSAKKQSGQRRGASDKRVPKQPTKPKHHGGGAAKHKQHLQIKKTKAGKGFKMPNALTVVGASAASCAPAAGRAPTAARAASRAPAARAASRAPTGSRAPAAPRGASGPRLPSATQRSARTTPAKVALPLAFARACPVLSAITPRVARGHVERALARQHDQQLVTSAAAQLETLRF